LVLGVTEKTRSESVSTVLMYAPEAIGVNLGEAPGDPDTLATYRTGGQRER
ncbi:unnamed protein product, partial [marine sediment metagenome]